MFKQDYLLSFLKEINLPAAEIARDIENLIFTDAKAALIRGRVFVEEILKDIYRKEEYEISLYSNVYERIIHLSSEGILTPKVKQSLDTIRRAGNRAAHEAGNDDILDAIKVFKSIYTLGVWYIEVYSTKDILIPSYRNPTPPQAQGSGLSKDEVASLIRDAIKGQVSEIVSMTNQELKGVSLLSEGLDLNKEESSKQDIIEPIIKEKEVPKWENLIPKDLPENRSYLLRELKKLQESSQEAVESAYSFSEFKDYMHIERHVQKDFEEILERANKVGGPNLILLCGSVGDGKSHLLAYINEKKPHLLENFQVLNDATESFSPNKNAIETLSDLLKGFSDQNIDHSQDKIVLAINLGVLHNFIHADHGDVTYNQLKSFVDESQLFEPTVTTKFSKNRLHLVGFTDYHSYELTDMGVNSSFYSGILQKIFSFNRENPFCIAYKRDIDLGIKGIIHNNYRFLSDEGVQNNIIQLVVQTIIKNKLVISARAFYNLVADLIVPELYDEYDELGDNDIEGISKSVPSLLFDRKERSSILRAISDLDPIHTRSNVIDELMIEIHTVSEGESIVNRYVHNEVGKLWLQPLKDNLESTDASLQEFSKLLIRLTYLTNEELNEKLYDSSFRQYINYLYAFNKKSSKEVKTFYEEFRNIMFKWRGSPKKGYIYLNRNNDKYKVAQLLDLRPSIDHLTINESSSLSSFKPTLYLVFNDMSKHEKISLEIDYPLYRLLHKVQGGYCPNKKDEEDAIKFVEFLEDAMKFGKKQEEILITIADEKKTYKLAKDDFGSFVFERE